MIRAILLDETPYLAADFKERHRITRYGTIYLYNDEEHTYCCSLSPSYWLEPVDYVVELRDNAGVSDDLDEELRECIIQSTPGYYDVRRIDSAGTLCFDFNYDPGEETPMLEAAMEAWHSNPLCINFEGRPLT